MSDTTVTGTIGVQSTAEKPCPYCGEYHDWVCPRVKVIEYWPNGRIKCVELWPENMRTKAIMEDVLHEYADVWRRLADHDSDSCAVTGVF